MEIKDRPKTIEIIEDVHMFDFAQRLSSFPVDRYKSEILYAIDRSLACQLYFRSVTILHGDSGSGKTTKIPEYLYKVGWARERGKSILISTVSDVSAINAARKIAGNLGLNLGQEVGYSTNFELEYNDYSTRIKVVTDEVLMKEIMIDPLLSKYEVVILTKRELCEFYSSFNDIIPEVMKKIMSQRRNLKLVFNTARCLDVIKLKEIFKEESLEESLEETEINNYLKVIRIDNHRIPLSIKARFEQLVIDYFQRIKLFVPLPKIFYLEKPTYSYIEKAVETIYSIHHMTKSDGDIQVFLTGTNEIAEFLQKMEAFKIASKLGDDLICVSLHSNLSAEELEEVFKPTPVYKRKVVVSALIGDTSIIVPNICYTIDCCFEKYGNVIIPSSKETCERRSLAAAKTKFGKSFRLCTQQYYENVLPQFSRPAILRNDLIILILKLKALGIKNIWTFKYLNQPNEESFVTALEILYSLGAIDDQADLTKDVGMKLVELPIDPKFGAAILNSNKEEYKCTEEILTIASVLSVNSIFQTNIDPVRISKTKKKLGAVEGDHITLQQTLSLKKGKTGRKQFCAEFYLNEGNIVKAIKVKSQLKEYLRLMGVQINKSDDYDDPQSILKSIITGFFKNIAFRQTNGTYKNIRSSEVLEIHPASVLSNIKPKWIIYNDVFVTTKNYMREVSEIDIEWVFELCPHYYKDTRKEYQQEKYKNESKLNTKRSKDILIQDQKLKESVDMMESRASIMKKPKKKMTDNLQLLVNKKPDSTSGIPSNRIRRLDLAPIPKDIKFDETKLDRMFPNKKQKREGSNNNLSFGDEDY